MQSYTYIHKVKADRLFVSDRPSAQVKHIKNQVGWAGSQC